MMLYSSQALAIGLRADSTNKYEMFVPNTEYGFAYEILTDGRWVNNYEAYADKELKGYVVFDKTRFENVPPGSILPLTGKIMLPSELSHPGWNHVQICAREDCPGEGAMCGRAAVCAAINFMMLYPGVNPVIALSAPSVNRDQPVDFSVSVENLGEEDIAGASGRIEVYNINKEKVGEAALDSKQVKSAQKETLTAKFQTAGLLPGNYSATAFVDCDGTGREANASFRIGTLDVKVVDYTKELETGGIKRFVAKVESVWNDPLDAYAEIRIFDSSFSVAAKTATNRILPWQTLDIEAFIDTSKLEDKEYSVTITVFYAEKSSVLEGSIRMVAPPESAVKEAVPSAAEQEAPQKQGVSATTLTIILVIVVIILTAVNIFLAVYRKRKD
ncbi:hypothetical protein JW898_00105 [Candidatus Woesearchaeota archaeon]|nr:hypothetical protein [Candidatus Woesearchaeota archaeon]